MKVRPTPDPIEAKYRALLNDVADGLDTVFNGPDRAQPRQTGFFLAVFDFDTPNGGRFNYISNADKVDVRAMCTEIAARIEGRMRDEGGKA